MSENPWSAAPEWLPRDIAEKLRECDREASLRGFNDTGWPRLWFSALWRSARLDFLGTLRATGRHPNDSSILSRADRAFDSPALFEAREQSFELQQELKRLAAEIARLTAEVERHRMPTEVRRGVEWAVKESKNWADEYDDEHDQTHGKRAGALAAYLARLGVEKKQGEQE